LGEHGKSVNGRLIPLFRTAIVTLAELTLALYVGRSEQNLDAGVSQRDQIASYLTVLKRNDASSLAH
jgi:hypothetical protein